MRKLVVYILFLLPALAFGQLFPKIPDFKGNVELVVEKSYGKESNFFGLRKSSYRPKAFSGWKCTYQFDENSKLKRRVNAYQGKVKTDYLYQYNTIENRKIEREIISEKSNEDQGNYIEYESIINSDGKIGKVNYWIFNSEECTRQLFMIEQNAEYRNNKLISFIRRNIKLNGDTATGEKCTLFYDSSEHLIRIERTDIDSDLTTTLNYSYNNQGFVAHYSVAFLAGLQEYGKEDKSQEIFYDYDAKGNWIKMYTKVGEKLRLEAKRSIKYYKFNL